MTAGLACVEICLTLQALGTVYNRPPAVSSQYTCLFLLSILSLEDLFAFAC